MKTERDRLNFVGEGIKILPDNFLYICKVL